MKGISRQDACLREKIKSRSTFRLPSSLCPEGSDDGSHVADRAGDDEKGYDEHGGAQLWL